MVTVLLQWNSKSEEEKVFLHLMTCVFGSPWQIEGLKPVINVPVTITPPPVTENTVIALSLNFETALDIYNDAVEADQVVSIVLDELKRLGSIENQFLTSFCAFKPQNIDTCDHIELEHLAEDLYLLKDLMPNLQSVIQYESDSGENNIVINEELSQCKYIMEDLIGILAEEEASGESETDIIEYNNVLGKPARCTTCSSHIDQYYIMKEISLSLGLTINHSYCIKEKLNPNN